MKYSKFIFPFLLGIFLFSDTFSQSVFLKIGDIKGETSNREHKDWINILSFSQGVDGSAKNNTGRLLLRKPTFSDFIVTKKMDRASPLIMIKAATGDAIPEVMMEMTGADGKAYYRITLKDVIITSVAATSACEQGCETTEELSMNYSKIYWEYLDQQGDRIRSGYNLEINRRL